MKSARMDIAPREPFDWAKWNRDFDRALANYDAVEAAITQAHINMARELRKDIEDMTK